MSDNSQDNLVSIDDRLADFTDQALSGKAPVEISGDEEPALKALAQTVMRVKGMVEQDKPDPRVFQRIKTRLKTAWDQDHLQTKSPQRMVAKHTGIGYLRRTWLPIAGVVAGFVLVVGIVLSVTQETLPGTAIQNSGFLVALAGAALLLFIILLATGGKK